MFRKSRFRTRQGLVELSHYLSSHYCWAFRSCCKFWIKIVARECLKYEKNIQLRNKAINAPVYPLQARFFMTKLYAIPFLPMLLKLDYVLLFSGLEYSALINYCQSDQPVREFPFLSQSQLSFRCPLPFEKISQAAAAEFLFWQFADSQTRQEFFTEKKNVSTKIPYANWKMRL